MVIYNPWRYAVILTYMLQNTEYHTGSYLAWFWRTQDFSRVMYRRRLDNTKAAKLLKRSLIAGMVLQTIAGVALIAYGSWQNMSAFNLFGLALILSLPIVWAHLITVPLALGRWLIVNPREQKLVEHSRRIFAEHKGVKIAVAGSYGKTTMKELLKTVLGEAKNVAATPGNKNVAVSHAYFASRLTGQEDILIIEYGEGQPGDVASFARNTSPTHGVITGLAPAHLDHYKTIEAAGQDIFSLADYLDNKQVYVNSEPAATLPFIKRSFHRYDRTGALGWKVKNVKLLPESTSFELIKDSRTLKLTSGLLGAHQIGPLSLVATLALDLGLSEKQVKSGIAKTVAFEHRMQPYRLNGGWVIDDTYNGNIEGIRAGTELLKALPANRKLYITPGLVGQGDGADDIHQEMGDLIAKAQPNTVVLMQNSTTESICRGLKSGGFKGKLIIEKDPLNFYTNLSQFVATGDVVLMQNDWTDNYA
ncbi:MAG: Mur ligase family protein [Candidatus Saccharimonadales bacterium]